MRVKLTFEQSLSNIQPIFINEDYTIESSSHISDSPVTLIGFVNRLSTSKKLILDLDYQAFYAYPALATNKYIILLNSQSEWLSIDAKITNVELIEE